MGHAFDGKQARSHRSLSATRRDESYSRPVPPAAASRPAPTDREAPSSAATLSLDAVVAMSDTTDRPRTAMAPVTFPVGYHVLHPDVSMNFQMNRWFGWVGEPGMLEEMGTAASRIAT